MVRDFIGQGEFMLKTGFLVYLTDTRSLVIAFPVPSGWLYSARANMSCESLASCHRTTPGEGLGRTDKRLDKISPALCGLRPRYLALGLVARTPSIFTTIITSPYCDSSKLLIFCRKRLKIYGILSLMFVVNSSNYSSRNLS